MIEDLESAGWVALCEADLTATEEASRRMHRAMKRTACQWLWGSSRFTTVKSRARRYPRRLTFQTAPEVLKTVQSAEPSPERVALGRIAVERVWVALSLAQRVIWVALVWYGHNIPRRIYHRWGWNAGMVHHRRMALRRRASGAMAGADLWHH